jgi:hypothetical protein
MDVFDDRREEVIFSLADLIDPESRRRIQRKCLLPVEMRNALNVISLYESEHDELGARRAELLKKLEIERRHMEPLSNELFSVVEKMRYAECRIKRAYRELKKEARNA